MATIYNTTDGPLAIDRAGRVLGGRERREVDNVDGSPLTGHISAGRIIVLDDEGDTATEGTAVEDEQPTKRAGKGRASTTTEEA